MNRFLSVLMLMLMCGLLLAGGAHATPVTWTIPTTSLTNCPASVQSGSISGTFVWDADFPDKSPADVNVTVVINGNSTGITSAAPNYNNNLYAVFSNGVVADAPTGWVVPVTQLTNAGGTETVTGLVGLCH